MPTAGDQGQKQARDQAALSAASVSGAPGGGGGSGGAVAALVQQAEQSQKQFQKLMQVVIQLQQENAQAVQAAGQSAAGAATEVANAVSRQVKEENLKGEKKRERLEDRAFQEDFARLNAKLQEDAGREAQGIAASITTQRESIIRFAGQFNSQRANMDEAVTSYAARTDEMLAAGFFDSKAGRGEFKKRLHLIDMMRANADDHFDDRHLDEAYRLHNDNIESIIAGDEPMGLGHLRVGPLGLPMTKTTPSGRQIAEPDSIPPDKMFEMKMMGGYPERGVVFNDEENFGMPAGYSPRLVDAETVLEALSRDDTYRFASDASVRRELTRKNQELVVEAMDRLEPLRDQYKSFNTTFNAMAPGAVDAAIREFMDDPNPHKFDDIGRSLTSGAIKHMFGGGSKGEKMALQAMKLFDGEGEMTTPEQSFGAMALESAVFNIKTHMLSEIQGSTGGGASLATQLVRQLTESIGEDGVSELLGVAPTAVGLVKAQDIMQQRLTDSYAFANRMHEGLWRQSVLETFRKDLRKNTRLADLFAFKQVKEGSDQQGRMLQLMGQDEAFAEINQNIQGQAPEDLEDLADQRNTGAIEADLNMLDAMILLGEELGPDQLNSVAAMVTGGAESPNSPNLQAYLSQTLVDQQRSGYVKAASKSARFNYDRQMAAKAKVDNGEKSGGFQLPPALNSGVRAAGMAIGSPIRSVVGGTFQRDLKTGLGFLTGGLPGQSGPLDLQGATRERAFTQPPPPSAPPNEQEQP